MRTVALLALAAAGGAACLGLCLNEDPPRVYTVEDGATAPRVIDRSAPDYTDQARMARLTGTVVVKLIVEQDATLRDVHVSKSLGMGLDEKALEAVKTWQFMPGTMDGKPVAVLTTVAVNFQLLTGRSDWRMTRMSFDGAERELASADYPDEPAAEQYATVSVAFDIDDSGAPRNLRVDQSTDPKSEPEVLAMLSRWRFTPGAQSHCIVEFTRGKPTS
jgi:TonB family protein